MNEEKEKRGYIFNIFFLSLAIFMTDASHSTVIPIFPGFAQSVGASLATLGSYGSVSGAAMLLLSLPLGRLSDRFGRKKLILPGLILFVVTPISYIFVTNPLQLYPIRIMLGLGTGLIFGNGFLLMSEIAPPQIRGRAQGLYMTSMGLGFTTGPIVGGFAATIYSTQVSFVISCLFAIAALILLSLVKENFVSINGKQSNLSFRVIISDSKVLAAGLANFLNSLMFNAVTLFFPVYGENIGFNEAEIGIGLTSRGLASTAIRLPTGSIARYMNVLNLMIMGLVLSGLTIFAVSDVSTIVLVSIIMGIQGIAYGIFLTTGNIYVAEKSPKELKGTSMALYSMFGNISSVITPLILGFTAETFGTREALQFSALASIILVLPIFYLGRTKVSSSDIASKNFKSF
jgi:MFS family permease